MLEKVLLPLLLIFGIFCSDSCFAQTKKDDKELIKFLMKQETNVKLRDTVYLHKQELLSKQNVSYGIYLFGLNSAHSNKYFFLKDKSDITIVPSLKLEEIICKVTDYFIKHPDIPFEDKVKYYSSILSIIEQSAQNSPWSIDE